MKPIDNYMTVAEAAYRYNIPVNTIKSRLKSSIQSNIPVIDQMIKDGHIKYFQHPEGQRKEWIISKQAMGIWFEK